MKRAVLNNNGITQENFYVDHDATEMITETVQDVEPILKENKELRSLGHNSKANGVLFARVPATLYNNFFNEWKLKYSDKMDFMCFMAGQFKKPEYAYLRTSDKYKSL